MSEARRKLAVVGAGVAGLGAALRVLQSPEYSARWDVRVYEGSGRAGGLLRSVREGDVLLDAGPDGVVVSKPRVAELCRALGLGGEMLETQPRSRRTYVARGEALEPMPRGMFLAVPGDLRAFLTSGLVSPAGRLRALADLVLPRRRATGPESISDFLGRRLGRELAELYGHAILAGIYAGDPDALEIDACFPQLVALEREHRSLLLGAERRRRAAETGRGEGPPPSPFFSLRNGMESLAHAMAKAVGEERLALEHPLQSLERDGEGWRLRFTEGRSARADRVLLCVPPQHAASLLEPLDTEAADALHAVPVVDSAIVLLVVPRAAVSHPLDASGFVVPRGAGEVLTACTFLSSKWEGRCPPDKVILRCFFGHAREQHTPRLEEAVLLRHARRAMERFVGLRGEPLLTRVARFRGASPQMTLGHRERVGRAAHRASALGLGLAGGGLPGWGLPDTVVAAEKALDALLDLTPPAPLSREGEGGGEVAGRRASKLRTH